MADGRVRVLCVAGASLLAWALHGIGDFSYEKILSRSVLLFAAILLIPLSRLVALTRQDVGLTPIQWRPLMYAWPVGLVTLAPLILLFGVTGFRVLDDRVVYLGSEFLLFVVGACVGAMLVSLFEEILFRGVLLSAMSRTTGFAVAATVSSLLYSGVHFFGSEVEFTSAVTWYSGLTHAAAAFAATSADLAEWDSFVSLFILGILLCVVRQRYGLWWCIGLHWVWVLVIRTFKEVTVRDVVNPYQAWVGNYDNFVGHGATLWIMFIFVVLALSRQVQQARSD